jgi:hypothetical protein
VIEEGKVDMHLLVEVYYFGNDGVVMAGGSGAVGEVIYDERGDFVRVDPEN